MKRSNGRSIPSLSPSRVSLAFGPAALLAGAALAVPILLLTGAATAAVIHVPAEQPTIQAGIDAAQPGDTVLVAAGTYTGDGNRDLDFGGKGITVASEEGAATCIIDSQGAYDDEHRGFYFHSGEGPAALVEGFTIRGGYAQLGGAIYCQGASPTIRANVLTANEAATGGGICCENSAASIWRNVVSSNGPEFFVAGTFAGGGIACLGSPAPEIAENYVVSNHSWEYGGGVACLGCPATLTGNVIRDNQAWHDYTAGQGGGIYCDSAAVIEGNVITGNSAWHYGRGGGICSNGSATITGNRIEDNTAESRGGGIYASGAPLIAGNSITGNQGEEGGGVSAEVTPVITGNRISGNRGSSGGGIYFDGELATITHNVISGNDSQSCGGILCLGNAEIGDDLIAWNSGDGAGICISGGGLVQVGSCTIAANTSTWGGGGIHAGWTSMIVVDTILWANQAPQGSAVFLGGAASLVIRHSDVQGGEGAVYVSPGGTVDWGTGMIDADPLFASAPFAEYALGQTAAGQPANSPCVDAGSAPAGTICFAAYGEPSCMDERSTRTDHLADRNVVDMGFHHEIPPAEPETIITAGADGTVDSPVLNFTFTGLDDLDPPASLVYSWRLDDNGWSAYSAAALATVAVPGPGLHVFSVRARDTGGRVDPTPASRLFFAEGWASGDDWDFLVTGPGPGPINPPLVRTSQAEWTAYGVARSGVNVACGELDGAGLDEVVTGPGPGTFFGPHVRGWRLDGTPLPGISFLAYGTHKYGVNVACGDIDGDGFDEIVTGAGHGPVFGAHVRGWNVDGGAAAAIPGVSYLAYGTPRWGVNVACGDVDGDGIAEIVTGPGPGPLFGSHVRGWNWDGMGTVTALPGLSFFAFSGWHRGVNVACGDVDQDGLDEIVTGAGPDPAAPARVRAWNYNGSEVGLVTGVDFAPYPPGDYHFGVVVTVSDLNGDGREEIWTVPGPGPDLLSEIKAWRAQNNQVTELIPRRFQAYDSWMTHGGRIAGGHLQ